MKLLADPCYRILVSRGGDYYFERVKVNILVRLSLYRPYIFSKALRIKSN